MLSATIDTLPHHPHASAEATATEREAAFLVITALRPRDPLEAMLAARVVAAHYHVMDNFRCAAQPGLPPNLQLRFQARAVALSRLMDATLHNLLDRQTAAARQPGALPAAVPTPRAEPAPDAARASPPPQLPVEGRHARRRRERAERPAAAARLAGLVSGGPDHAMRQRLLAEVAARAAASITALAA
jgi:hypothetical protein